MLAQDHPGGIAIRHASTKLSEPKPIATVRRRVPKWALEPGQMASPDSQADSQYYLRSIGRALEVLDCFDGRTALSLKDLVQRTAQPESTLFRVLLTLEHHRYLTQGRDGTYQLTPKLIFGWLTEAANRVRELVRPEIERLATHFNETASLAYLHDDRIHVLDCVETFHEIRMTNRIGRVLSPHSSALGKAITAFQDRSLADRMLEVYGLSARTEHTITDRLRLFEDFTEVRRTGISCDREESVRGGICFGAAVRSPGLPVVCAISLSIPTLRMTDSRELEIQAALLESAARLATLLPAQR